MAELINSIRQKLKKNQVSLGSWITMADPMVVEIMCQSGFDWLAVDMEHSALTLPQVQNHVRIIQLSGLAAFVRVEENNPNLIKRVMDAGVDGLIVPMVNSRQEAQKVVDAVRYPPAGKRGVGLARAQGYGSSFNEYKAQHHKRMVVVQIEHIQAVENLEAILSVPGVDSFIVGPYDLSGSLGVPGQFDHPKVKQALEKIMRVSKRMKIPSGFHVIQPETKLVEAKVKAGFRFISFSIDMVYLKNFVSQQVKSLKRK